MSFFEELKQRKVFRVAVAYLAMAWLLIQVAAALAPQLQLPEWAPRLVTLILMIGFPVALVMAWAFDMTPEGIRLDAAPVGNKRLYAVAASLLVLAIGWYVWHTPTSQPANANAAAATTVAMTPERSIAVLPFVNMSGDPKNDYFSDGLAETTLDMLAQVPDLKVIARTSSFAFKGKAQDMRQIGAALGAAHLLEGSVQQAGDTLRITVQLIKVADGSHLWSQHYDRPMTDLFKIQDEIASHVVQELAIALPAQQQQHLVAKRTDNLAAYQEYLKGNALLRNRKVPEMREALAHFERAIALDPNYARAYAAAADTHGLLGSYATIAEGERERMARYTDRALALAPDLGEAHITRATELSAAGNAVAAESEFRRGIELAPGYASGYQWYGEMLANQGRFDEALPVLEKAIALDPLSPVIPNDRIFFLGASGRIDEALTLINQQIAAHPDFAKPYSTRAQLNELRGDLVAGLRDYRTAATLAPEALNNNTYGCHLLIDAGALVEAKACLASFGPQATPSEALLWAETRLALIGGDTDGALALFGQLQPPFEPFRAYLLLVDGRPAETLAIERKLLPGVFAQSMPQVYPGQAQEVIFAGIALLKTGATAKGQALLRTATAAIAHLPYASGRGWWEVYAFAELGEKDRAFAAMQDAVNSGYFLGLAELDADPLISDLRADPRYQKILAPARTKAAAQVEAARKAGLL